MLAHEQVVEPGKRVLEPDLQHPLMNDLGRAEDRVATVGGRLRAEAFDGQRHTNRGRVEAHFRGRLKHGGLGHPIRGVRTLLEFPRLAQHTLHGRPIEFHGHSVGGRSRCRRAGVAAGILAG